MAAVLHLITVLLLALLPLVVPALGSVYAGAMVVIAGLLLWEHWIVRPDDLSRVNQAFFNANATIGMILLVAIAVDLWA